MKRIIPLLLIQLLIALLLVACGRGAAADEADDGRLFIVTTIGQIADVARIVGGDHVRVTGLMGPGTDPHLYKASARDVDRLRAADVVFYNGLFLEAQMEEVLEQLGELQTVVAVSAGIDPAGLLPSANYADEYDPHIWFDVALWMQTVEQVRDTLMAADPANAAAYEANAAAYLAELAALHAYVAEQAATIPAEQRVLVTAHDAFSYFGRAYGFEVLGLQGISTASEAGTADVQRLADTIATRRIPAVFVESSVPVRNIEAVQAAVRARDFDVVIGGRLFSDAMGDTGTPEGTYAGMVRYNIDTIVSSLRGEE
ncbi:Periplasmic zinc-binding protein TroA [Candidatus Promineifilum breve]|uniref:Periplasmic zinc-binding protein TroA n=1 Tax=Candidatus Promineifilum breve TaxID=1806508 RepID=A0A160T8V8_9CHLR|nr:zinc ABC transporter substrate-binding protein [Candidatus Promineifilum breve]CUS05878.1 Periplasmic zinc-binding protein TroA [Candidatus Promineifilum breve]